MPTRTAMQPAPVCAPTQVLSSRPSACCICPARITLPLKLTKTRLYPLAEGVVNERKRAFAVTRAAPPRIDSAGRLTYDRACTQATVAQSAEHRFRKAGVEGSTPPG